MKAIILSAVLVMAAPLTAAAQQWTPEQLEVWEAVEWTAVAFNQGDMSVSYEAVHPDFVFWNSDNSVPGDREAAFALDTALWGPVGSRMYGTTASPLTILVYGDFAAVHAYVRGYRSVGSRDPEFSAIRWTSAWKKEDGKWLQILNYIDPDN